MTDNNSCVYLWVEPVGFPFMRYIGHGTLKESRNLYRTNQPQLQSWIDELKSQGLRPRVILLKENLTKKEAAYWEYGVIHLIGRRKNGDGPLLNWGDGGEGGNCGKASEKARKNCKLAAQKRLQDPEYRKKHKLAMQKMVHNPEWIKNNKLANQKRLQDPEYRKKHKLAMQKKGKNPEYRKKNKLAIRQAGPSKDRKFKGVHKRGNKYQTSIRVNGKSIHLGYFDTEIEAAIAYNDAVDLYWNGAGYKNPV